MYEDIYEVFQEVAEDNINRELFNHSNESPEDTIEDIKNNKLLIYTAFTGDYDSLKEPEFIDENCDYVCFTDNPNLKSDTWKIIFMEESTLDNNRKAKQYKVLPHKYFPDYKYSFWLDGTFKIKGSIREYIYKNIKANSPMLNVIHTERDCIYEEYEASKIIPRYPRAVMEEQMENYKKEGFPKHYGLAVMGAIFRQHNNPEVINLMEAWWDEIIKYSNQDQLSFAYVAWKQDFHPSVSLLYYWDNEYWAKEGEYHHKVVLQTPITSDNLRSKIGVQVNNMSIGDTIDLSKEELLLLINDIKGMNGYRIDTAGRIAFLNNEYSAMLSSNSLKLTKPLRVAGDLARRFKKNRYFQAAKYFKTDFSNQLSLYYRLKNLNLINEEKYLAIHPEAIDNPILHYMAYSSKNDFIDVKASYVNPLFDMVYYLSVNDLDLDVDSIVHYVSHGFFNNFEFNREHKPFIKNLKLDIDTQYENYVNTLVSDELKSNNYISDSEVLKYYIEKNEPCNDDKIKVGVFLEDSFDNMNACPFIRLHVPFKKLSKKGKYQFFVYGRELLPKLDMNNVINCKIFDVMVIQRNNAYATELLKKAKMHGIKVVYEVDDDLVDLSPENPSYIYINENKENIVKLVENADKITVTTTELKNRFLDYGYDNVEIIRNYFVDELFPLNPFKNNETKLLKIGYFGTLTHDGDLELIHNVILRVKDYLLKENIKVELEVVGGAVNNAQDWYSVKKLPFYPMPMSNFMKWLNNNVNWDVGIAPLVSTEFNKCKSELKYIEFSALGIPVVASRIEGYEEAIDDGVDGYLATSENEWVSKLVTLLEDPVLRNGMVNNAHDNILKNYSLNSRVEQWDNLFERLIND